MAKAYQCDRCFNYYTANKECHVPGRPTSVLATGITIEDTSPQQSSKKYELCDDCLEQLFDFLMNREIRKAE